jgi:hypothetical protein
MPPRCCMLGLKRSRPSPMSQIDLSQFVNKKVKVTTRDGVEHIDYIKKDNGFKFGVHHYHDNGWLKSSNASNITRGLDIIKIEEVTDVQTEVGQLRDEIGQLKKMVLDIRNDMVGLKQLSIVVSPRPSDEINLLEYVGKKVEITFRNGVKNYVIVHKMENEAYPIKLRSWDGMRDLSCYANGRQLSKEEGDFDIVHVEELTLFKYAKLNEQVKTLNKMVVELKNEVKGLKQTSNVPSKPSDEINLLEFVGKQVVITFRNKRKDYGTILQTTGYYPIKLRGWNTDMTCYNDGRQLLDEECDYDIIHVETLTPLMYDRLYEQMQKLLKELNNIEN